MNVPSRGLETVFLFWLLIVLFIALIVFGHNDPRQVLKMRLIGVFMLFVLAVLRTTVSFGKFHPASTNQQEQD